MVDPYEDYRLFKTGLSQMIVDLSNFGSVAGLDVIQALSGISTVNGLKSVNGLGGMTGTDAAAIIDAAIQELEDDKNLRSHWPPFFDRTCLGTTGSCFARNKVKFVKKIGAEFTVGEVQEDGTYHLDQMNIYSIDPIHGRVERKNTANPYIDCSGSRKQR